MESLARLTWLFIRGEETIHVSYSAETLSVSSQGPGHDHRRFAFADEATAAEFLRLYEHYLAGGGWTLQAFVERRAGPPTPPDTGERRRRRPPATP